MARQQNYLAEHYRPGFTAERLEQLAARVRATAAGMAREGEPVSYLHSTIVPTDESLLCLFEAPSDALVRAVYARAGVPFERLTAVISDDTPTTTTRPPRQRANRPGGHMFASRTRRTIICAIVFALLASTLTGVAPASANERTLAAALAQERYYMSKGEPETIDAGILAAEAQERYYSSYGEPEPLSVAQSPEPSDDTPWLPIALSVAVALAIVATSATLARRLRIRRRTARVTA